MRFSVILVLVVSFIFAALYVHAALGENAIIVYFLGLLAGTYVFFKHVVNA